MLPTDDTGTYYDDTIDDYRFFKFAACLFMGLAVFTGGMLWVNSSFDTPPEAVTQEQPANYAEGTQFTAHGNTYEFKYMPGDIEYKTFNGGFKTVVPIKRGNIYYIPIVEDSTLWSTKRMIEEGKL